MKKHLLSGIVIAVSLLAGIAVAQSLQQFELFNSPRVSLFTGGVAIGRMRDNNNNTTVNANRITRTLGGTLVATLGSGTAITCTDSASIVVRGAQLGDTCSVGSSIITTTPNATNNHSTSHHHPTVRLQPNKRV